jgi:hypothetical protein
MVELVPAPDPTALLPPLLACLPASFASPRPPPVLLPLLSPILRQRLQLNTAGGARESWAALLCWDATKGERLKDKIEDAIFEPHPVSGEIEVGDTYDITYKRFDEETLRAQIPLADWPFTAMYLWCTGAEEGDSWKLAELLPFDEDLQKDPSWSRTVSEANESAKERLVDEALQAADQGTNGPTQRTLSVAPKDEDDYWAMYDNTPGRTPSRKESVAPRGGPSEEDYYSRYASVQPAMDNHDPDEKMEDDTEPRLNGNALHEMLSRNAQPRTKSNPPPYEGTSVTEHEVVDELDERVVEVTHPVPSSPSSRGSIAVARLEESAERLGASEIAIKQHVSSSMKSMYRLAKSAGITRSEFEDMINRELETLSLLDLDD